MRSHTKFLPVLTFIDTSDRQTDRQANYIDLFRFSTLISVFFKGFEFSGEKSNLEFLMGINKNKGEIVCEQCVNLCL